MSARTTIIFGMVKNPIKSNQNLRVLWKVVNLQDCVWENLYRTIMKTIIQKKETIHHSITIWLTFLHSYASKPKKLQQQRQQWIKNGEIGEIFGGEPNESQKKERGDRWSKDERRESSFRLTDGHMSLEECWIGGKAPKIRRDIVKDDTGSHAVFTEKGSSTSLMTAAKGMDITSRLPCCAGQAADAVFACTPGKNGRCSKTIENSKIGVSRHLDSPTTTQMAKIMVQYGRPSRSFWTKSVRSSFGRTVMGKAIWENSIEVRLGEVSNWECFFVHREKGEFLSVCVDDIKLAGKKQNIDPIWKVLNKEVDLGEPTSFLDHVYLGCTS